MTKQLTIKDIAKYCGVGVSTVSRAINDDDGISEETKARVLEVVRKFHYVPNNAARNIRISESNTIALLVRGIDNIFFQSMFDQFQDELLKAGMAETLVMEPNLRYQMHFEEVEREARAAGTGFWGTGFFQ